MDIFCYREMPIPELILTSQGSVRHTIKGFKWSYANIGVVAIVTNKFTKGKMQIPTTNKVQYTSTQHVLQHLDSALKVSIGLGMISSTKIEAGAKSFLKAILEVRGETRVPV